MKVFCSGFNYFGQLDHPNNIILGYVDTKLFNFDVVDDLHTTISYSLVRSKNKVFVCNKKCFPGSKFKEINVTKIVDIACSDHRILLLNESGTLYKIELDNFDSVVALPKFIGLEDDKIIKVYCGAKISVCLTQKGKIFNIPNKLDYECDNIYDIKLGTEHCILLDKQGNVYTFGCGLHGQLGHGVLEYETQPKPVDALAGIKITKIAAGGWHSCAISEDGDLYIWGSNKYGQLGLGGNESSNISMVALPQVVDFRKEDVNVLFVACGNMHTIALLDDNKLYGCGNNKYHQLNEEKTENLFQMTYLHDFSDETVKELKCGPWNSLVICK